MPNPPPTGRGVRLAALSGAAAAACLAYWAVFSPTSQIFGPFPFRAGAPRADPDVHGADADERGSEVVALTFDDGPNEPYTSRLLDVLDARDVRATFFEVGRCAERFPSTTRRVVETGHVLGNHSFSHSFTSYARQPTQRVEIERGQEALYRISGVAPALYRPPWLCHLPWVLDTVTAHGLQVVSGTFIHPLEVFQPAASTLTDGAARVARPGSVLIFHDGREARGGPRQRSVDAVGPLIDRLRDQGYGFTTVDRLLGVDPYL